MPRTAERGGPLTRARILEVSNRLFVERGYDAVTVAEIAREAGVSSVTVFKHFPRKEDLYLDRSTETEELLRAAIRGRTPGQDPLTLLHELTVRLAETRHPLSGLNDQSLDFFRTIAGSPALIARARELAASLEQALAEELEQAATASGHLVSENESNLTDGATASGMVMEPGDARLLAAFFIAGYATVLVETARQRLADEPPRPRSVAEPAQAIETDHRARLERLFDALRGGVTLDRNSHG